MILGGATAAGTVTYSRKFGGQHFNTLGLTQWQVSQAGFGGYRVSAGIDAHFRAMAKAFCGGINVVDTSTNYTDGGSEKLVGQVLAHTIGKGFIARQEVVIVSKVGYIQGRNYALSREREREGDPFPDLVPYSEGLAHCIHPEFIEDQLTRSLERLQIQTLDLLLLHNPEYYLGWAKKQGLAVNEARETFYQRIAQAFEHLENVVSQGRIQAYGISANTFPVADHDAEFISLERVLGIAENIAANHHFRAVQFPLNLYEPGAVLERNQSQGRSLLACAQEKQLGVLINRPLNAFTGNRLVRLANVEKLARHRDDEVIHAITLLNKSEKVLWRKILPALNLPLPLYRRVKDQASVGDQLKHYWRNFGNYERWRQFKDGLLWPHVQGVFDFLRPYADQMDAIDQWLRSHQKKLDIAVRAIGSLYVDHAAREVAAIRSKIRAADDAWNGAGSLSQLALRVLRSSAGVHTVLVGMRRERYVDDVFEELARPVEIAERIDAWKRLHAALTSI